MVSNVGRKKYKQKGNKKKLCSDVGEMYDYDEIEYW